MRLFVCSGVSWGIHSHLPHLILHIICMFELRCSLASKCYWSFCKIPPVTVWNFHNILNWWQECLFIASVPVSSTQDSHDILFHVLFPEYHAAVNVTHHIFNGLSILLPVQIGSYVFLLACTQRQSFMNVSEILLFCLKKYNFGCFVNMVLDHLPLVLMLGFLTRLHVHVHT